MQNNKNSIAPQEGTKKTNRLMKLRFSVDQANAFRQGTAVPSPIVTISVDPSGLSGEQRNLIAERMIGNDVYNLVADYYTKSVQKDSGLFNERIEHEPIGFKGKAFKTFRSKKVHIEAALPTIESLMEAVEANEKEIRDIEIEWKSKRVA